MASGFWAPLSIGSADGPTLTAAAAASCLPVTAKYTFPPNPSVVGTMLHVVASGRISCVITTPGTARYDFRIGGNVFFDTLAMNLNIVAKTTVFWQLDVRCVCRIVGSSAQWFGQGFWMSDAVIGAGVSNTTGIGTLDVPVNTAPALGTAQDWTGGGAFDCFFTQTVATGSMTVHNFLLESATVPLP
jgi:hypothetical protein